MFEERPAHELESLFQSNPEFKQLYQQHRELDRRVLNAELGVNPVDDFTLAQMKRQKLYAKDRLVRMAESQPH